MSLRLRLVLTLIPLVVLGLVVADVGTYESLDRFLLARTDAQLDQAHVAVESVLTGGAAPGLGRPPRSPGPDNNSGAGGRPGPDRLNPPLSLPPETFGEILSPTGTVLAQQSFGFGNAASTAAPVIPPGLAPPVGGESLTVPGTGGVTEYRAHVQPTDGGTGNLTVVAIPLDDVVSTLHQLLLLELAISGGVTIVLIGATWVLVRRSLRPLQRMEQTARSIAAGDLSSRVVETSERSEAGRLGIALNAMLGQIEAAFAARAASEARLRAFVSDASHELRTPLTSMRGWADLFRRNPAMDRESVQLAMRRIGGETERMGHLVDDLLLLARLDQGRALEQTRVDLEALVEDSCADARVADPDRLVTVRIGAPLIVIGDALRIRQVVDNLVRNAIVHTPAGTPVEVALTEEPGRAVLEIIDHGQGVPLSERERIFERFHRAEPERSRDQGGSGLGLGIVVAIVTAHGGRVGVHDTAGGGATFRVELPLHELTDSQEIPSGPGGASQAGERS